MINNLTKNMGVSLYYVMPLERFSVHSYASKILQCERSNISKTGTHFQFTLLH